MIRRVLAALWPPVAAVLAWQWLAGAAGNPFFPEPSAIWARAREAWFTGPLLAGWMVAGVLGIVLGLALGRSRWASEVLDPLLQFGRALPPPALVPFFVSVFQTGTRMQLVTIVFGVVWPVLLNAADGARGVDPLQLDTARAFGLPGPLRLRHVILPAALPKIFAGLRLSLSLALILMVLSELVGSTDGIGYRLQTAQRDFDLPGMWGGIVLLGVLGMALNGLFLVVERRVLAWHRAARETR